MLWVETKQSTAQKSQRAQTRQEKSRNVWSNESRSSAPRRLQNVTNVQMLQQNPTVGGFVWRTHTDTHPLTLIQHTRCFQSNLSVPPLWEAGGRQTQR